MDIADLQRQLDALTRHIGILEGYQTDARARQDALLEFQIERDLREAQGQAKALREEIARFTKPDAML